MADTTAEWHLSLDTKCPNKTCLRAIDLRDELVNDASAIEACETDTVATLGYEATCPYCGHEFTVDFVY